MITFNIYYWKTRNIVLLRLQFRIIKEMIELIFNYNLSRVYNDRKIVRLNNILWKWLKNKNLYHDINSNVKLSIDMLYFKTFLLLIFHDLSSCVSTTNIYT